MQLHILYMLTTHMIYVKAFSKLPNVHVACESVHVIEQMIALEKVDVAVAG